MLNEKTNVKQIIRNQKGSDDFKIIESKTLLHMIIENRNMVFLSKLLKERRDIGINQPRTIELIKTGFQNKYYLIESITPLYIAIANNNNEISDVLLSNENIEINKEKTEKYFIKKDWKINKKDEETDLIKINKKQSTNVEKPLKTVNTTLENKKIKKTTKKKNNQSSMSFLFTKNMKQLPNKEKKKNSSKKINKKTKVVIYAKKKYIFRIKLFLA